MVVLTLSQVVEQCGGSSLKHPVTYELHDPRAEEEVGPERQRGRLPSPSMPERQPLGHGESEVRGSEVECRSNG